MLKMHSHLYPQILVLFFRRIMAGNFAEASKGNSMDLWGFKRREILPLYPQDASLQNSF